MLNFFINGIEVHPPKPVNGVYEIEYSTTKNRLPRKLKKRLKIQGVMQIKIINDWIDYKTTFPFELGSDEWKKDLHRKTKRIKNRGKKETVQITL